MVLNIKIQKSEDKKAKLAHIYTNERRPSYEIAVDTNSMLH